ncbi:MAG TPA: shikimate kinase AroK [Steroidobacteraceae bacterium]|nr:shikimate kinase AroK [Steroidobacteraceae bacterium]
MLGKRGVFLIGPMGSGKSAVGRLLARMLDAPFYDSDTEIERRTGVDISYIFEKEGEARFRQREREVIDALTRLEPVVLATGGGAVLLEENRRHLAERGYVVYLEASVEQQARRVHHARHRPLLMNVDPAQKLEQLMSERGALYRGIADLKVATDGRKIQSVAEEIASGLKARHTPYTAPT